MDQTGPRTNEVTASVGTPSRVLVLTSVATNTEPCPEKVLEVLVRFTPDVGPYPKSCLGSRRCQTRQWPKGADTRSPDLAGVHFCDGRTRRGTPARRNSLT